MTAANKDFRHQHNLKIGSEWLRLLATGGIVHGVDPTVTDTKPVFLSDLGNDVSLK